jgi:peptidoglycan/xylan/chitin deacetylase (PgdA/CDA1 family)
VGVPRLLERLGALGLPATFFIPGHTIESFPSECEAILAAPAPPASRATRRRVSR